MSAPRVSLLGSRRRRCPGASAAMAKRISPQLAKAYLNSETLLKQVSKEFFDNWDADTSGYLERNELTECSQDLYRRLGLEPLEEADLSSWIEQHDTDRDGKLSREEFQNLFKDTLQSSLLGTGQSNGGGAAVPAAAARAAAELEAAETANKQRAEDELALKRRTEAARAERRRAEKEAEDKAAAEAAVQKSATAEPKLEVKKDQPVVKKEWQQVFETLQTAFPNKSTKEILAALKRTDGHAGRAKRFLRE